MKTRKLNTETNTPAMEKRVADAFFEWHWKKHGVKKASIEVQTNYEHGQWWITYAPTGAQYSVVDTTEGFDFEQVTEGDES